MDNAKQDGSTEGHPLLTFAVLTYNQEKFIQEAVKAALAQTYQPLEVIISDDCSTDSTYSVIKNVVRSYSGPHRLIINQNAEQLGIIGHVNRVMTLTEGKLVIAAAGDDISFPHRTERVYEAWLFSKRKATSLFSQYTTIDERGTVISPASITDRNYVHSRVLNISASDFLRRKIPIIGGGCSHVWSRRLFELLGPLPEDIPNMVNEDFTIAFRSSLLGAVAEIPEPLVYYRRHSTNVSSGISKRRLRNYDELAALEIRRRRMLDRFIAAFYCAEKDVNTALAKGLISVECGTICRREIAFECRCLEIRKGFPFGSLLKGLKALFTLARSGCGPRAILHLIPRLLPYPLFARAALFFDMLGYRIYDM